MHLLMTKIQSEFQARVLAGEINVSGFNWLVFCYDESKYDLSKLKQGLLQGYLLLRIYCHIFTGLQSALGGKSKGWHARGALNNLTKPTAEMISYAAIMVHICDTFSSAYTYLTGVVGPELMWNLG